MPLIEANGTVDLTDVDGAYVLVPDEGNGTAVPVTDENGVAPPLVYFGFEMIHAEADPDTENNPGGFKVLWKNADDVYITWTLNSSGVALLNADGEVFDLVSNVGDVEFTFGFDINGDGKILESIESNGAIELKVDTVSGQYFADDGTTETGFTYLADGAPVTADSLDAGVSVLQLEQNPDGTFIVLLDTGTGLETATATAAGVVDQAVEPSPITTTEAEALFQIDLDGNGFVGPLPTPIEADGEVDLVEADGAYLLVPNNGAGDVVPVTDENGVAPPLVYFGFEMIHAEADPDTENNSGGFKVLWKNADDVYITWTLNSSGQALLNADGEVFDLVSNVGDVEFTFQADINGDGKILESIESNGAIELKVDTVSGQYFADDGTTETGFTYLADGAPVTADSLDAGVSVLQLEQNPDGTFIVLLDTGTGLETSTATAAGVVDQAVEPSPITTTEAEALFQIDLDGNGTVGPLPTPIETDGTVDLDTVDGAYVVVPDNGNGTAVPVTDENGVAPPLVYFGFEMIHAEADPDTENNSGGFKVLWKNADDVYITWTLNSSGVAQLNADGEVFDLVSNVGDVEFTFQADVNGDGTVGPLPTAIETDGTVDLDTVDGAYVVVPDNGNGTAVPVTDENGVAPPLVYFGFEMIHAEADPDTENNSGGFKVLWKNADDVYITWTLNSSGVAQLNADGEVFDLVSNVGDVEFTFGFDINGDGKILESIESNGAIELKVDTVSGQYFMDDGVADIGLTTDGSTPLVSSDLTILQAGQDDNLDFFLLTGSAGAYETLAVTVDAATGTVNTAAPTSILDTDAEVLFQIDLDGNGTVGPLPTPIETDGTVDLDTVDGAYVVVPDNGNGTAVPVTDENGVAPPLVYFGFEMIHAEADPDTENNSGGFKVLWKNADDVYITWTLNSSGVAQLNADGEVFDLVSNVGDVEFTFQADVNGDGTVGPLPTAIETDGTVDLDTVDGAYVVVPDNGNGTAVPVTDENGVAPPLVYFGFEMIHAEADPDTENNSGGFKVLWKNADDVYITWTLNSSGVAQLNADGEVFDLVSNVGDVEFTFGFDINGDGKILESIESNGAIELKVDTVSGQYFMDDGVADIGLTTDGSTPLVSSDLTILQAGQDDNLDFFLLTGSAGAYETLAVTVDAATGTVNTAAPTSILDTDAEVLFQIDLDGNGTVGPLPTPIETDGTVDLDTVDGAYVVVPDNGNGTAVPVTDENGVAPPLVYFGFEMIHAEADPDTENNSGGFKVLWKNADDVYITWTLNSSGVAQLNADGEVFDLVSNVGDVEFTFQADVNGDGKILESIESNGAIELKVDTVSGQYFMDDGVADIGLTTDGSTPLVSSDLTILQAGQDDNLDFFLLTGSAGAYETLAVTVDAATGTVNTAAPTSILDTDAEVLFQIDLDGNGFVGPLPTPIEADGEVDLVEADGAYLLVPNNGAGDVVPVTDENGVAPPLVYFGFEMIHAEADPDTENNSGGFKVLWKNADDVYITWTLNSSGVAQLNADGEVFDLVSNVGDVEQTFQADLDGDEFLFIEGNGVTTLKTAVSDGQYTINADIGLTNDAAEVLTPDDFNFVQATQIADAVEDPDYFLLLIENGGSYATRTATSGGELSSTEIPTPVSVAEEAFGVDLDGDGFIGDPVF